VSAHDAIIEAGPGVIRRLCCGASEPLDAELIGTALDAIDDRVALVGERPKSVDSVWRAALRSVAGAHGTGVVVVHPSWWSSSRVGVLSAAAHTLPGDARVRPRSWLLARATLAGCPATVVVEIAEQLVMVAGAGVDQVVAIPRLGEPRRVAEEVAEAISRMAGIVLLDAPDTVGGAPALATALADAVRGAGRTVVHIDDARLKRLARAARPARAAPEPRPAVGGDRSRPATYQWVAGATAVILAVAVPTLAAGARHGVAPARPAPTTFLVEGRVALTVPADWPTRRVVTGPGSARVQATSPSDLEVALHITQSHVPGETLSGTADRLKRAIDAEPAGVFVDFNPSGATAGRPAVTYREVRATHHVRWTVLLDGAVRISVGCQSRPGGPGGYDAVRDACEQAVRSAHAIG